MRVLHVQRVKGIGGSERHLLDLLGGLRRGGVDARMLVLTRPGAPPFLDALAEADVPFDVAQVGGDLDPKGAIRIRRSVLRWRPDVVHTHLIHADVAGALATLAGGPVLVSTAHSAHGFYARAPYRWIARAAWSRASAVIAISQHAARYLHGMGTLPRHRTFVVPYGIDVERWVAGEPSLAAADRPPTLVMTGRMVAGKGHATAIQALELVRREVPDTRLLLVGDGPMREELRDTVAGLGLADAVTFEGFQADVRPFLWRADAALFLTEPTLSEGFGLAALEAMAAGLPLIATATGPLPDLVGEAGVVVRPSDPADVASALVPILRRRDEAQRLGAAARARAAERFSLDAMLERTIEIYDRVAADRRPTATP